MTTVWFAVRLARDMRGRGAGALASGHYAPHLVHSAAMVYMFVAVVPPAAASGGSAMAGMGGAAGGMSTLRFPTIALAFALVLAGALAAGLAVTEIPSGSHAASDGEPAAVPADPARPPGLAWARPAPGCWPRMSPWALLIWRKWSSMPPGTAIRSSLAAWSLALSNRGMT